MTSDSRTLGQISDEVLKLQTKMKKLETEVDVLKKARDVLLAELIAAAETQKLEKGGGKTSSFIIKENTVPQVDDWDLFYAYMYKKKYMHLLQRRPGVSACQELWDQGVAIPGVEKYTSMKATVKEV